MNKNGLHVKSLEERKNRLNKPRILFLSPCARLHAKIALSKNTQVNEVDTALNLLYM